MITLTCSELADVAPELALGTLPGRQRAAALAHLDRCADCRLTVEELSDAADTLLLMAPEVAPSAGFARRTAKGFVAQTPTAPDRLPIAARLLGAAFFHPQLKLTATRQPVLRNAHFTKEAVHSQPGRALGGGFQVFGKAAPGEGA